MFPSGAAAFDQRALVEGFLRSSEKIAMDWHAGILLILDNARFLHGRGHSLRDDADRVLKRVIVA